jgi:hypothetical protein
LHGQGKTDVRLACVTAELVKAKGSRQRSSVSCAAPEEPVLARQGARAGMALLQRVAQPPAWPGGPPDIRALIRQFEPLRLPAAAPPPADWTELPRDIMRLVVAALPAQDVQAALLACREWHRGFSSGLTAMRPRVFMVDRLASRRARAPPPPPAVGPPAS